MEFKVDWDEDTLWDGHMPRYAVDKYPIGSYVNQKAAGIPINPEIARTLRLYAKKILRDMQFLALISGGDGGVRMGKSTAGQGWGGYYTEQVNKILVKNGERKIPFNENNICMSFEELKEKAFTVPKYSCLILDESDDLTAHAQSKMMNEINSFLQKNGQLNLFIILIIDDFFKFPAPIAVTRSNFLAVVKFRHDDQRGLYYQRGFYDMYSGNDKRILYYKGKKNFRDINCHRPTLKNVYFHGQYYVDEEAYKNKKLKDLETYKSNKEEEKSTKQTILMPIIENMLDKSKTLTEIADVLLMSTKTLNRWGYYKEAIRQPDSDKYTNNNTNNQMIDDDVRPEEDFSYEQPN